MNKEELLKLLNQKIEIKKETPPPITAADLNATLDNFATKLNETFKQLTPKSDPVKDEQGVNNDKQ